MSTRLHISVPDDFLARLDAALPDGMSRAHFIRRAVERAIDAPPVAKPIGVSPRTPLAKFKPPDYR